MIYLLPNFLLVFDILLRFLALFAIIQIIRATNKYLKK